MSTTQRERRKQPSNQYRFKRMGPSPNSSNLVHPPHGDACMCHCMQSADNRRERDRARSVHVNPRHVACVASELDALRQHDRHTHSGDAA